MRDRKNIDIDKGLYIFDHQTTRVWSKAKINSSINQSFFYFDLDFLFYYQKNN